MTSVSWVRFFGLLLGEASVILLLVFLVARLARPIWQRTIWHAAMIGLAGLLIFEGTGTGQSLLTFFAPAQDKPNPEPRVVVTIFPSQQRAVIHPEAASLAITVGANEPRVFWWPVMVWLLGMGVLASRSLVCRAWFIALKSRRSAVSDPRLLERIREFALRLSIRKPVQITQCKDLTSPVAYGIFRPAICLPEDFTTAYSVAQQDAILTHELGHLSAKDPLWYCLVDMVTALWWWHPLVWWSRHHLQAATELAADECSLLLPGGPENLAVSLVQMGRSLAQRRTFGFLGMDGNGFRSGLGRRVSRLLGLQEGLPQSLGRLKAFLLHAGGLMLLLVLVVASSGWTSRDQSLAKTTWEAITRKGQPQLLAQATPQKDVTKPYVPQPPEVDPATGLPVADSQTEATATSDSPRVRFHTRWFKVDQNTFVERIKGGSTSSASTGSRKVPAGNTNLVNDAIVEILGFFKTAGVDLSPPKTLFYNDRLGMLMARATLQDLEIIEQAIQVLNMAPPQLTVECKFIEFPVDGSMTSWLQQQGLQLTGKPLPANRHTIDSTPPSALKVLTPALYRELTNHVEQQPGAVTLATPRITTLSGRQAQIKVVDVKSIVTDMDYHQSTNSTSPVAQPIIEQVELGPCLDVVPNVSADGYTISMTLIPSIKEFLGYDKENARKMLNMVPSLSVEPPLPMFRHRVAMTSTIVWDGQTALVYLGSFEPTPESGSKATKHRIVLVTATIIDAAGNRLHSDTDGPFRNTSTPSQRPVGKP